MNIGQTGHTDNGEVKRCLKCDHFKQRKDFHRNQAKADGYNNHCKACVLARLTATPKQVPERKQCANCREIKQSDAFYVAQRSRDGLQPYCKRCTAMKLQDYYQQNPEPRRRSSVKWKAANPERAAENVKAWAAQNPDKRRETNVLRHARDRAKQAGAEAIDLTTNQWRAIQRYYNHACAYCRRTDTPLELEHVVPFEQGGGHTASNVVPSCPDCNTAKGRSPLWQFVLKQGRQMQRPLWIYLHPDDPQGALLQQFTAITDAIAQGKQVNIRVARTKQTREYIRHGGIATA